MPARTTAPASPAWDDVKHPAWLGLSARTGELLAAVSGRDDVVAIVHPGAPESDYAEFYPALAEGRFAPDRLLIDKPDPAAIDPCNYTDRCLHPAFTGAVCHEAAHAAHTKHEFTRGDDPAAVHWATQLEEPRIEHRLIQRHPGERQWLRATAQYVIVGSLASREKATTPKGAVGDAVLILGRAAGGLLDEDEVAPLAQHVEQVIGRAALDELNTIFTELFALADEDQSGILALGARVAKIAQDDGSDHKPNRGASGGGLPGAAGGSGAGTGASGHAQGSGAPVAVVLPCGSRTLGEPSEGGGAPGDSGPVTGDGSDGHGEDGPAGTLAAVIVAAISETATAEAQARVAVVAPGRRDNSGRKRASRDAQEVFNSGGVGAQHITVRNLNPSGNQQRQARTLLRSLAEAQYRDVHRTTRPVAAPPGRMVMREVVRRAAQIEARTEITANPWNRITRRQAENPPLTVGISLDVSGSMDPWIGPVASTGWALAHAVASPRLAGTIAANVWNGAAASLIEPGKRPRTVPTPSAGGGSNGCPQSLYALDGVLNLTTRNGARAVVVVTDGFLWNKEEIQKATDHLTRAGVLVLWLKVQQNGWAPTGAHAEFLADPDNFGPVVGRALAQALSKA